MNVYNPCKDAVLIGQIRAGGEMAGAAFRELVEALTPMLYSAARGVGIVHEAAEDALQNACVDAWEALSNGAFYGGSSLRTWLTRITINAAIDVQRGERRRPKISLQMIADSDSLPEKDRRTPYQIAADNETHSIVRAALAQAFDGLSEKMRTALILFHYGDIRYREIAADVGVSIGTIRSKLYYARCSLADKLDEEGITPEFLSAA